MQPAAGLNTNLSRSGNPADWLSRACSAGYRTFGDHRLAASATIVRGAARVILTGGGSGFDVAAFGAAAFSEIGVESAAIHAGDMMTNSVAFEPGDAVIGIDTDSPAVARALNRARRAGIHTIGLTTRDLTIVDSDVLLPVPIEANVDRFSDPEMIACSLTMALIAARLEPGTALAGEVASVEKSVRRVGHASQSMVALLADAMPSRLIVAGQGHSSWTADALARQLAWKGLPAVAAHISDIDEGYWSFSADDVLIEIDPVDPLPDARHRQHAPRQDRRPPSSWKFSQRSGQAAQHTQLPGSSPAIRSLVAFATLALVFEQAPSLAGSWTEQGDV